jgi:hypothetical protein
MPHRSERPSMQPRDLHFAPLAAATSVGVVVGSRAVDPPQSGCSVFQGASAGLSPSLPAPLLSPATRCLGLQTG